MSAPESIFASLLLPDERVLWNGKPDWRNATPRKEFWRSKAVHFLWIFGLIVIILLLWCVGEGIHEGFTRTILGVLIVLFSVFLLPITASFLDFKKARLGDESYAITDRRVIILDSEGSRRSIAPNVFLQVRSSPNGKVHDLNLWYGHEDNEVLTFQAISDHGAVEKLILERFMREGRRHHE